MSLLHYSANKRRYLSAAYVVAILCFFLVSAYVLYSLNVHLPELRVAHIDARLPPSQDSVRRFVHIILIVWSIAYLALSSVLIHLESKSLLSKRSNAVIFPMLFAIALGAALTMPIGSSDLYQYLAYGWILSEHNVNPYFSAPRLFAYDPIIGSLVHFWWDVPCNYGPIALLIFAIPSLAGASTVAALSIALKGIWLICYLIVTRLFYRLLLSLEKPYPVSMTGLLFLNPFAIWFWLIDGHMDILPITLFFATITFLIVRKWILAGVFTALFCASKVLFIIIIPFFLLFVIRESAKSTNSKSASINYLTSTAVVLALLYVPFKGAELLNVLSDFLALPMRRLPGFLGPVPGFFYHMSGVLKVVDTEDLFDVSSFLGVLVFCGIYLHVTFRSMKGKVDINTLILTCGIVLFWFACSVSYSQPWYVMWFYPIIFASLRSIQALLVVSAVFCLFSVAGVFSHPADAQKLVAQFFALAAIFLILKKSWTLLTANRAET